MFRRLDFNAVRINNVGGIIEAVTICMNASTLYSVAIVLVTNRKLNTEK